MRATQKNSFVLRIIDFLFRTKWVIGTRRKAHRIFRYVHFLKSFLRMALLRCVLKIKDPNRTVIAILGMQYIGDLIAFEPIARHLREKNPGSFIVWVVNRRYRELFECHPALDACLPVFCFGEWHGLARFPFFDRILDLHKNPEKACSCRPNGLPDDRRGGLDDFNYLEFGNLLAVGCRLAGLPILNQASRVYIPERVEKKIDELRLPDSFVVIHGLANDALRSWTPGRWNELIRKILAEQEVSFVEIGTLSVFPQNSSHVHSYCGRSSLLETAEIIRRASFYIGVDSGPAHMANSFSIPAIILMARFKNFVDHMTFNGAYEDENHAKILRGEKMEDIPVDEVLDAFKVFYNEKMGRLSLQC